MLLTCCGDSYIIRGFEKVLFNFLRNSVLADFFNGRGTALEKFKILSLYPSFRIWVNFNRLS